MPSIPEITCTDVSQLSSESNSNTVLLDVREEKEFQLGHIANAIFFPLSKLEENVSSLDPNANYIAICRVGGRSGAATKFLLSQNFKSVKNMVGGMIEWARVIDPSIKVM
ncbi:rhodanese-like domain-containing protein [bacterium]|nr:rhodanese-like domain-containing protein [bacterium]